LPKDQLQSLIITLAEFPHLDDLMKLLLEQNIQGFFEELLLHNPKESKFKQGFQLNGLMDNVKSTFSYLFSEDVFLLKRKKQKESDALHKEKQQHYYANIADALEEMGEKYWAHLAEYRSKQLH